MRAERGIRAGPHASGVPPFRLRCASPSIARLPQATTTAAAPASQTPPAARTPRAWRPAHQPTPIASAMPATAAAPATAASACAMPVSWQAACGERGAARRGEPRAAWFVCGRAGQGQGSSVATLDGGGPCRACAGQACQPRAFMLISSIAGPRAAAVVAAVPQHSSTALHRSGPTGPTSVLARRLLRLQRRLHRRRHVLQERRGHLSRRQPQVQMCCCQQRLPQGRQPVQVRHW